MLPKTKRETAQKELELFGTHKVSFAAIRTLAIQCHALHVSGYELLMDGIHIDDNGKTRTAYEELCTSTLLGLAIAIRTKFYQGLDHAGTERFVLASAMLFEGEKEIPRSFTMKDVCDKIIHADSVHRSMEAGVKNPTITLVGKQAGTDWSFGICVSLFAQGVLDWCDQVEE